MTKLFEGIVRCHRCRRHLCMSGDETIQVFTGVFSCSECTPAAEPPKPLPTITAETIYRCPWSAAGYDRLSKVMFCEKSFNEIFGDG